MITQSFYERYLVIQCQILDKKILSLKKRVTEIKSDMVRDFRYKAILLERKKNKLIREINAGKANGSKSYDLFISNINKELQELCSLYNHLFNQLESYK